MVEEDLPFLLPVIKNLATLQVLDLRTLLANKLSHHEGFSLTGAKEYEATGHSPLCPTCPAVKSTVDSSNSS